MKGAVTSKILLLLFDFIYILSHLEFKFVIKRYSDIR